MKSFYIVRIEETKVLKRVRYDIPAKDKNDAVKKLGRMQYAYRDTIDEIGEDSWKPMHIIEVDEA